MRRTLMLGATAALLAVHATPAFAWDEFGHVVIGRIAWQSLNPQVRDRAIQILRAAPPQTGIGRGFPQGPLSPEMQIALFVSASHWPDDIRSPGHPAHSLHRGDRHFVNLFWRQDRDFGPIRPGNLPPFGDLLRDMPSLRTTLTGSNAAEASIALAWIIHLVGDIHQPLHSSSRITPLDRGGDRGGNDFDLLGSPRNLHSFWDGVITRNHRRRAGESDAGYLHRVAADIASRHPASRFGPDLAVTDESAWAREGVTLAQRSVYRRPLAHNSQPPRVYERAALEAAEPRVALAGYRLAALLNRALGSRP